MQVNFSTQTTITENAVFKRLKRHMLRVDGLRLHRCRQDSRWLNSLHRYYAVHVITNSYECGTDNIESWARDAGVIKAHEVVVY